jgi:beta-glucosidase
MKPILWLACTALCTSPSGQAQNSAPPYPFQNPSLDIESRIDDAISRLTLDEKINGLNTTGVKVPRLGIPGTPIGEALSGIALGGPIASLVSALPGAPPEAAMKPTPTTQFPQGVGLARTWDRELMHRAGAVIGSEARYIWENHLNDKDFLVVLTPNADIARDPRWGRDQETYGEDPYFNGAMAAPFIRGIQGDDPKYWQTAMRTTATALPRTSTSGCCASTTRFLSAWHSRKAARGPSWPRITHGTMCR